MDTKKNKKTLKDQHTKVKKHGRVVGVEPTNIGTTIRGLNHLAIPAISIFQFNINIFFFQYTILKCRRPDSNRYTGLTASDFESDASTNFATSA